MIMTIAFFWRFIRTPFTYGNQQKETKDSRNIGRILIFQTIPLFFVLFHFLFFQKSDPQIAPKNLSNFDTNISGIKISNFSEKFSKQIFFAGSIVFQGFFLS